MSSRRRDDNDDQPMTLQIAASKGISITTIAVCLFLTAMAVIWTGNLLIGQGRIMSNACKRSERRHAREEKRREVEEEAAAASASQ